MHLRVFLLTAFVWSLPTAAQQPLLECGNTYECCIRKYPSLESCGPGNEAARAVRAIDSAMDSANLATAIDGEAINSQLVHIARHLALILELEQVGGVPPGEPRTSRRTGIGGVKSRRP